MEKIKPRIKDRLESFDFDYWMHLAKKDPEKFVEQRKQAVDAVIDSAPLVFRKRLRGLQWRVDMEIMRSKNTMDSCLRINRMMMDAVYSKGGLVDSMENLVASPDKMIDEKGVIIPFPQRSGT